MACCMLGAKPRPEPMLIYHYLDPQEKKLQWNFSGNAIIFIQEMYLKKLFAKCQPLYSGLSVVNANTKFPGNVHITNMKWFKWQSEIAYVPKCTFWQVCKLEGFENVLSQDAPEAEIWWRYIKAFTSNAWSSILQVTRQNVQHIFYSTAYRWLNALELLQSCTEPSICIMLLDTQKDVPLTL